jgi:hypothetical protein
MTGKSFITVKGSVDEKAKVTITSNDRPHRFANRSGNAFNGVVYLVPGINTITITAIDQAGNSSSSKRTITYDNDKPTLAVTEPVQDLTTTEPTITLSGSVADTLSDVTVSVTMAGQSHTPAIANGLFQQQLTFSNAGQYAVKVTATDALGHQRTVIRNVIYRPAP